MNASSSSPSGRWRVPLSATALVLREAARSFAAGRNMESAATLAYYGFLSLMPLLLLVIYILGLIMQSSEAVLSGMENLAGKLFPAFNKALLEDLLTLSRQRLWGWVSVGVLFWSLTPFAAAIRSALWRVVKAEQRPGFLKAKLLDLAAVLVLLVLFLLLAAGNLFSSIGPLRWLVRAGQSFSPLRLLLPLAGATLVLMFFYRVFAPGRVRWGHVLAGALVAAVLLAAIRPLFGAILRINPNYGYAFGSLKAIFLLIVWVYYNFGVMLFGAEVMAAAARRDALLLRKLFMEAAHGVRPSGVLLEQFTRNFAPGETVFREGEAGDDMYYILAGSIRLLHGERELRMLAPGEYFGEMSLLIAQPRTATALAAGEGARLAAISPNNLDVILRENPAIVMNLLKEMARRLKNTNEQLPA